MVKTTNQYNMSSYVFFGYHPHFEVLGSPQDQVQLPWAEPTGDGEGLVLRDEHLTTGWQP
jgi:hypothetical protein